MSLEGRVAFITGGGGTIGNAMARAFAEHGASVTLADADIDAAGRAAGALRASGLRALAVHVDVCQPESVAKAVAAAVSEFNGLDILVNNAGICPLTPFERTTLEEWNRVLAINLTGAFLCVQEALPHLKRSRHGRIINVGSVAGRIGGIAPSAAYSVSKAGLMCLTKCLALALAEHGITANSIAPGPTETTMTAGWSEETKELLRRRIPMKRFGQAEEVAAAALYLASDAASYVTGATIDVNGGLAMF
ncbi:MAG: SDR family NAD(P)-dependent oxidoreductase [Anaerolineae bacterium]